ncbi:hypothetical protein PILCRDRAFT_657491 [Piloderma croceum F 1598]|uniref:Uncharacterized protein n=1 Tax=Piloderma croceum (strain F 1598) TaxID=765440 RepID=A0A0C3AQ61_PILCF|nr:hypothetical protein PILCRDRAFT_657491 [Piloderma croceum F 1598]
MKLIQRNYFYLVGRVAMDRDATFAAHPCFRRSSPATPAEARRPMTIQNRCQTRTPSSLHSVLVRSQNRSPCYRHVTWRPGQ